MRQAGSDQVRSVCIKKKLKRLQKILSSRSLPFFSHSPAFLVSVSFTLSLSPPFFLSLSERCRPHKKLLLLPSPPSCTDAYSHPLLSPALTIELHIGLKNYDPQKYKRFRGSVILLHFPRSNMKICMLGDAQHVEEVHVICRMI